MSKITRDQATDKMVGGSTKTDVDKSTQDKDLGTDRSFGRKKI